MEIINKVPRWALTFAFLASFALAGTLFTFVVNKCYAEIGTNATEIQNTKVLAYQAKRNAEEAQLQYADLRGAVQELKNSNETFRREYREDQKEMARAINELLHRR